MYPLMLYKGKVDLQAAENVGLDNALIVNNADEEKAARASGYGEINAKPKDEPKPEGKKGDEKK